MNDAILKFRRYEDAPLAYTASNRHASGTRIGLADGSGAVLPSGCLFRCCPVLRPDDHPDQDQRHRGQDHQPVVEVAGGVPAVGDNLPAPQRAGAEQLAEEGHHDEHQPVAEAVHHAVHDTGAACATVRKPPNGP